MRKGNIGVAPEGLPFLFLLALTALAFAALRFWPLALVFLVLTWFSGHFFRDPERVVPSEDDIAVSPADGRVIRVEPKADPITGEVRPCISIFMNVFNVHVNRSWVCLGIKSPDIIHEVLSCKYFSRIRKQCMQQIKFFLP